MNEYIRKVNGIDVPMTKEEIEARKAEEAESDKPKPTPLAARLDTIFKKLPTEAQAQFYTLKTAVKLALEEGNTEAAQIIIKSAEVPPEFEELRAAMLVEFKESYT